MGPLYQLASRPTPNGDLAAALVGGREGRVFPVKSNEPDPVVMSQNLKHLARWWGADFVGIVPLPPGHDQIVIPSGDAGREDAPSGCPTELRGRRPNFRLVRGGLRIDFRV